LASNIYRHQLQDSCRQTIAHAEALHPVNLKCLLMLIGHNMTKNGDNSDAFEGIPVSIEIRLPYPRKYKFLMKKK
jgi:hypothetical protein